MPSTNHPSLSFKDILLKCPVQTSLTLHSKGHTFKMPSTIHFALSMYCGQ